MGLSFFSFLLSMCGGLGRRTHPVHAAKKHPCSTAHPGGNGGGGGGSYTVQPGDTLSAIAAKYRTTVGDIVRLNPEITNPDMIDVGQVIKLPGALGRCGCGACRVLSPALYKVPSFWAGPGG